MKAYGEAGSYEEKYLLPLPGIEPQLLGRPALRTVVITPTTLNNNNNNNNNKVIALKEDSHPSR
jgi:hypothetical protein